jgi:hypothetical protein
VAEAAFTEMFVSPVKICVVGAGELKKLGGDIEIPPELVVSNRKAFLIVSGDIVVCVPSGKKPVTVGLLFQSYPTSVII